MIANGIIDAIKELDFKLPVVVRFQGTNSKEGRDIINNSSLGLISIDEFFKCSSESCGVIRIVSILVIKIQDLFAKALPVHKEHIILNKL